LHYVLTVVVAVLAIGVKIALSKYREQLASCRSTSVTVQARIQQTAKDLLLVWMTIAALVRLNWCRRNVLTYLLNNDNSSRCIS